MCFPNCTKFLNDPTPMYDDEGTLNKQEENELYVDDRIHNHVDSICVNFDVEDGILAFIYENANGLIIVWTSEEAEAFGQLCEALEYPIL